MHNDLLLYMGASYTMSKLKATFETAWLALLPLGGWFMAYCYTYGQYVHLGIPATFLEVTLARVLQATLAFLVLLLTMGQHLEQLLERKKSVRPEVMTWVVVQVIVMGTLMYFSSAGERLETAGRLLAVYALLWLPFVLYGFPEIGRRVIRSATQVMIAPTLTQLLDVVVAALALGGMAFWLGWSAYFIGSEYVVIGSECGPLTRVLIASDSFLVLRPSAIPGQAGGIQLLPISEAKGITFRISSWAELRFRNAAFEGPCMPSQSAGLKK